MKKVSEVVRHIIEQDSIAYESLWKGFLQVNAYARLIHARVVETCMKDVKINTIVTALLRFRKEIIGKESLVPSFTIEAITVKVGLMEMAFEKGETPLAVAKWLGKQKRSMNEFFLTIEGNTETDFIFPERLLLKLQSECEVQRSLHGTIAHLAAITLSYPSTLTFVPNVGYALMRSLALKRINIVEVVSSYSEVSFLVDVDDVERALDALKYFLAESGKIKPS